MKIGGQRRLPALDLPAGSGGRDQVFTMIIPVFTLRNNCVHDASEYASTPRCARSTCPSGTERSKYPRGKSAKSEKHTLNVTTGKAMSLERPKPSLAKTITRGLSG